MDTGKISWGHVLLFVAVLASPALGQGAPQLYTPNPVDISMDYYTQDVALWGENLASPSLQVEWDGNLYPGTTFNLTYRPQNEVTFRLPASVPLAMGIHTVRLYEPATRAYSNPVKLLVSRATAFPPIPLAGPSTTAADYFWGLWGGEEAVLQAGNIYAFVNLFDLTIGRPGSNQGLPFMGFRTCASAVITDEKGQETVVPGDGSTHGGWRWTGCPSWPRVTNNWWAELYPPTSLAAGVYTVKLRSVQDSKDSNSRSLIVLPPGTPPFVINLDKGAVVHPYSGAFPPLTVRGYNLARATTVYFDGPVARQVSFQPASNEQGTFSLPPDLLPGDYQVHLGDAGGPTSNRRPFRVIPRGWRLPGPSVRTFVHLNFRDTMWVDGGNPDRWMIPGALRFVHRDPLTPVPFFWRENVHNIFFNGQRADGHRLLDPDQGTIEIRGYRPQDWPLGRSSRSEVFNHGYHHLLNIFTAGGNWRSKEKVNVRTLYYIPDSSSSWGYWDVWSYWNGRTIPKQGNWTHFEAVFRDGYSPSDHAILVTDPSFAAELAEPLGTKTFDLKIVYDFVGKKEGAIFVKVRGKDTDYVDRTFPPSRKIATSSDRVSLAPIVSGGFDLGTEKRHPHRILEPSQTAKSGAGGSIDELTITDQAFDAVAKPEVSLLPGSGTYGPLTSLSFKVLVRGRLADLNWDFFDIGYLYLDGSPTPRYYSLRYLDIWFPRVIEENGKVGYLFTLYTYQPFPKARYLVSVSGLQHRGAFADPVTADLTTNY